MDKYYKIESFPGRNDQIIVISIRPCRPDEFMSQLETDLQYSGFKGRVYFDFLLPNGPKDRFYFAVFDGNRILRNSFKSLANSGEIETVSNSFFGNNSDLLEIGNLTSIERFLFRKRLLTNNFKGA